ncbi:MAG: hypothetical protein LBQ66_12675, partial [Planctomycetaceae bacterium]|nr:hypothetical protein [Planctomycetaceae bacterium]
RLCFRRAKQDENSGAEHALAKPIRHTFWAFWFWAIEIPVHFGDPVVGLCRRYSPRKPGGRLPTLRLPTRFGVQFKLVRFYYAQRRAGRPRSSPRRFAAKLCGITRPRTYNHQRFFRTRCRLRRWGRVGFVGALIVFVVV